MTKAFHFYDSAGVRRNVKEFYFYDSTGIRRKVKEGYFYDSAGVRRQFYSGSNVVLAGVLTAEDLGARTGFLSGEYGELAPLIQFAGGTAYRLDSSNSSNNITFEMTFPANPGAAIFTTLTLSGVLAATLYSVLNLSSASATFTYTGGVAKWSWTATQKFANGELYDVTVTP